MNLPVHHSGQISGQVQNQASTMLPGLPQQTGSSMPQMQNPAIHSAAKNDYMILRRKHMQEKILEFLMQRRPHEVPTKKMIDIVKRLEESLFKNSTSVDEYQNLATLESRLHLLLKGLHMSNQNQQFSNANSSPAVGTMIPTPGLQQASSLTGTSSMVDNSFLVNNNSNAVTSSSLNSGSFMPNENGSSMGFHTGSHSSSGGTMSGGFQHSSSAFSVNSVGNNLMSSVSAQKMTSQMIPTPGFNSSNNADINIQSLNNSESNNNVGAFSAVESSVASQPMQQKPQFGGQNSRILHNIGGHLGSGIRSTLQQRSYGLSNGPLKGGLSMMGNNMSMMNGSKAETMYGNNTRLWQQQQFNQRQQPLIQGDGSGIGGADTSGSGNMYVPVTSAGSVMNNQNLSAISLQSMSTSNTALMNNQSNAHSTQLVTNLKPQIADQHDKMNLQSQHTVRENFVQNPRVQQLQHQQGQLNHGQFLSKNDNIGQSQVSRNMVSGYTTENYDGGLQPQANNPFQFSDVQNQFQGNSIEDRSRSTQMLQHPPDPLDVSSSMGQPHDQMMQQMLYPQQFVVNQQNDFGLSQQDVTVHDQWYSRSQDMSHVSGSVPLHQGVEDQFNQRITGQSDSQLNTLSLQESASAQTDASKPTGPANGSNAVSQPHIGERERQYKNQLRWLLFLRHARRCPAPEGKCLEINCSKVQRLLKHMESCNVLLCPYPGCCATRDLIDHHRHCRDSKCPVCIPVKNYVQTHLKPIARSDLSSVLPGSANGSSGSHDIAKLSEKSNPMACPVISKTPEDLQSPIKRMKIQQNLSETIVPVSEPYLAGAQHSEKHPDSFIPKKSEVKMEDAGYSGQLISNDIDMIKDNLVEAYMEMPKGDPAESNNPTGFIAQDIVKSEKEMVQVKTEKTSQPQEVGSKSGKPKIMGVSLTELFTPEQVRQHITGLRQWVGQSKAKAEKNQAMGRSMSENSCQLCAVENLTFEPPPIYCTPCGARIKKNASYYTVAAGDTRHYVCVACYNEARGDTILVDGNSIPKAKMAKKKNDEETDESWVQCDKCEAWQHQICALFNGRRNEGGQAEYTCPNCYIKEVERGERMSLPHSAVLGAKDLPRTILSDHVEQRLFAKLKNERQERARIQGKSYDEVPGAESLVVRVVSSVDKKLEVKPRFLEIFQEENYPTEFPYKSKVILLFQNIEGVEVCLFGMYVQEFGSECQQPSQRRVYLSYLDSVKYFRPDVKTVTGEALRTFVYHEILIGYLDYCKMRGFTSCYIWACPPLKGEDYILYCHPEIQKTPKSDKLREWYLSMLKKASREKVVVDLTNLYDHFFVSMGECKAKVTAARLPYFDGDYWPGAAEDMIYQLQQEDDGRKQFKKGTIKKTITKRALKASGQIDLSGNVSKDLLLMHRLGETILPMKEDFIMVHLQHACTHCCILMVSGNRWVCKQCKNFQLCDKCYDAERKREDRERHPTNQKDKHSLYPIEIKDVPEDTKDRDEILESEFFDTRQAFLSLCQGNHYQYDTLRRAKHSSMMVLYHLHNPTAPAFVMTCNVCHLDIETGQGWRCETCPDYDVCNACYLKDGGMSHPHKLTNHPSSDRDAQNKEARQLRVQQLRKMLDLLVHASLCRSLQCQYPNCRKVKGLFRHGILCKKRISGNCVMCKKMWYLLQLHARACKESQCSVPRCKDLKEHMRRLQQQSESRRRAAVNEMMRQRATEDAGSS